MSDLILACQWPRNRVKCLHRHCEKKRNDTCKGFTVKSGDGIGFQNLEFDAVEELTIQWRRLQMTAVVEDDYPQVRHEYEGALSNLIRMAQANGRKI
jgi:hypothetical protein